jgi:YVTN family beta-propeller protein
VAATDDAIYVTNQGANTLAVIDPSTRHVVTTVTTGNSPYGVAVDPISRSVPHGHTKLREPHDGYPSGTV